MTKTVETEPHSTGVNCSVKLKLGDASLDSEKVLRWPISEMVFLVEDELVQFPDEENHWWDFEKNVYQGKPNEINEISFRDDTMVFGTTKGTSICGVIHLNSDLWCEKFEFCFVVWLHVVTFESN